MVTIGSTGNPLSGAATAKHTHTPPTMATRRALDGHCETHPGVHTVGLGRTRTLRVDMWGEEVMWMATEATAGGAGRARER